MSSGGGPARPADAGAVALFADEASYRAYAEEVSDAAGDDVALAEVDFAGHTSRRLAALFVGDRGRRRVVHTLVHELAHLLNVLTLAGGDGAGELPVWLDEGLAGDLDLFPVDARGRLRLGPLGPGTLSHGSGVRPFGPLIALDRLVGDAALSRLESVSTLLSLQRRDFLASPRRAELYALAAFWVRYLLADGDGEDERAATFRRWLGAVAAGASPDGAVLLRDLGATDETRLRRLDSDFQRWLVDLARRLQLDRRRR